MRADAVPDVVAGVPADAEEVVRALGCASELVDITPMVDGYFGADGGLPGAAGPEGLEASAVRRGNFAARMRMSVIYDRSVTWGGLVVGTGNKTEGLIGYTTIFGDNASAFNPIGDLYKSQVRQLAVAMGVPTSIIRKAPSADLWPGQTDESEGGFSYRCSIDSCSGASTSAARSRRWRRSGSTAPPWSGSTGWWPRRSSSRQVPPIAKLGPRTSGIDYLYPRRRPGSARG